MTRKVQWMGSLAAVWRRGIALYVVCSRTTAVMAGGTTTGTTWLSWPQDGGRTVFPFPFPPLDVGANRERPRKRNRRLCACRRASPKFLVPACYSNRFHAISVTSPKATRSAAPTGSCEDESVVITVSLRRAISAVRATHLDVSSIGKLSDGVRGDPWFLTRHGRARNTLVWLRGSDGSKVSVRWWCLYALPARTAPKSGCRQRWYTRLRAAVAEWDQSDGQTAGSASER